MHNVYLIEVPVDKYSLINIKRRLYDGWISKVCSLPRHGLKCTWTKVYSTRRSSQIHQYKEEGGHVGGWFFGLFFPNGKPVK